MRIILRPTRHRGVDVRARAVARAMSHRREQVERLGRIRQFVFGAQDGLLSTLGVVTGVSGATTSHFAVLVAGCAEAVAGMFAMAAGEYISSRSQAQVYQAEIEMEREELRKDPAGEREEIQVLFRQEGLSPEDAETVARLVTSSEESWLKTMTEKELGLTAADASDALPGALIIGAAFLLGAVVTILPYLLLSGTPAVLTSVVLTLITLAAIGAGKAKLARIGWFGSAAEVVAIGSAAAIIGYLFGTLLPHIFHVP
jgi:VIT1/CCC1 family predicted Fe2+/Mn2+ transporter